MKFLTLILTVYTLLSPSGNLRVEVNADAKQDVSYAVYAGDQQIIAPSSINMTLSDDVVLDGKVSKVKRSSVDRIVTPLVYKKDQVRERYNSMLMTLKNCKLEWRAYDEGVAYRFITDSKKPFKVLSEKATFNFPDDYKMHVSYVCQHTQTLETQFFSSQENTYTNTTISGWNMDRIAFPPILIDEGDYKVCITESDLHHYPGMFLYKGDGSLELEGRFAPYPKEVEQGGHNMLQGLVKSREDYLSEIPAGTFNFPWRLISVVESETQLAQSDMVWLLAAPEDDTLDWSWLRPGKVAWDWWNDWNIRGVDFESGVNNPTYEFYIDFAADNGIEYVIMDEGWSVNKAADLMQVVPEINLPHLVKYAEERGVGIVLWAGYWALNRDIEGVCKHYSEMGVKGFKVDFMDRDDCQMVDFYDEVSRIAAKYHLFVDFHGAYKPTGLNRTWPNVFNFEGVFGLENLKWNNIAERHLQNDVTIPFIRMFAGPMDYTQGAMRNGAIKNFHGLGHEPMSAGTRCRQLAEYVIFDAPFTMLCDCPNNYMDEPECTEYISNVPTTWDKTLCIDGRVAEYVVMAREKDGVWYVGALTGVDARDITIDLSSFLPEGKYDLTGFRDGANAHKTGRDYRKYEQKVSSADKLFVHLAPGGGYTCILTPIGK